MKFLTLASLMFVFAACGGGDEDRIDARPGTADAPPGTPDAPPGTPDAPPGTPDAPPGTPDAMPGAVEVISCVGQTPDATITTSGLAFSPAATTINAGDVVQFIANGPHDMTSGTPGNPDGEFETPTSQDACLRFNVAGVYPYYCSVHPLQMDGVVTVN